MSGTHRTRETPRNGLGLADAVRTLVLGADLLVQGGQVDHGRGARELDVGLAGGARQARQLVDQGAGLRAELRDQRLNS
jgi:hypothetical protein